MDIRQKEAPFQFRGKEYKLRCNFNVIADVVAWNGGKLPDTFDESKRLLLIRDYLAAMLNDYADEMGWPERVTPKELGRELGADVAVAGVVLGLVINALYEQREAGEEADSKN